MYLADDTIVALATPPGRGGMAVVRLSGGASLKICAELTDVARPLEARRATLVRVVAGTLRDEAIATWFQAPASFTGEDVVELSLHGSPVLVSHVIAAAVRSGARMARPGEFTLRAFLNGRLDLAQAEAVQDLVGATTAEQARIAFDQLEGTLSERIAGIEQELFELTARLEASVDFPDEGYHFIDAGAVAASLRNVRSRIEELIASGRRGRVLREGATAAIVGRSNVGKSSVFNALAGGERAIVTEIPGTTRDLLAETISVEGVPLTVIDTAGTRETSDPVEQEGVRRAEKARGAADVLLVVLDRSTPLMPADHELLLSTKSRLRVVLANKSDKPAAWNVSDARAACEGSEGRTEWLEVSAPSGEGLDGAMRALANVLGTSGSLDAPLLSNVRHLDLLERANSATDGAIGLIEKHGRMPEEIVLVHVHEITSILSEVTGRRTTEDLLDEIFSKFCIGK